MYTKNTETLNKPIPAAYSVPPLCTLWLPHLHSDQLTTEPHAAAVALRQAQRKLSVIATKRDNNRTRAPTPRFPPYKKFRWECAYKALLL